MLSIVLVSCFTKKRAPKGILEREEMVKVLSEIYVTEEKVNRLSLSSDSAAIVFEKLRERVFQKVGTQDSILKRSMQYYTRRPKEMEQIYTALVDSLSLREQRESVRDTPSPDSEPSHKPKSDAPIK